ncbi:unnamed protein product [Cylicocyclus nassatus]|uniref:G-protein coupled receptors family 1 profile domain-containing protein n=1 Tax=Cylicocyclus nassatus TaxID=53992 RepID=A0AA36MFZ6_CYLNA|nr:unnamed protein product [Cylicocyclus nassatus]
MSDAALRCLRQLREPFEERMTPWRITYGIILTILSIVSIFMNVNLTIVVLRNDTFNKSLRLYLLSATLAGLVGVIPLLLSLIPSIFFRVELRDPENLIISVADALSFLIFMLTTTIIALDRLLFFILPQVHGCLNSRKNILSCLAALPVAISVAAIIHMFTLGCYKRTDPYALAFTHSCSKCSGNYRPILSYMGIICPAVNFGIYVIVFLRILAIRKEFRTRLRGAGSTKMDDILLIIQFILICLSQFGSSGLLPLLTPYIYTITSFQMSTIFTAINTMINPIVIFALQKRMRRTCFRFLKLSRSTNSTVVLPATNPSPHNTNSTNPGAP